MQLVSTKKEPSTFSGTRNARSAMILESHVLFAVKSFHFMALSAGTRVGSYEIVSPLAQAAWGRCIARGTAS